MTAISEKKRAKITGRGAPSSFHSLPHFVLNSQQWASLSGMEVKMLIELGRQYRGNNNGDLCSPHTLPDRGWRKATALDVLHALELKGWIVTTRQGGRHIGCSLFAITWESVDDCGGKHHHHVEYKASHAWKNANGGTESVPRRNGLRTAKPVEVRKADRKVVPIRPD